MNGCALREAYQSQLPGGRPPAGVSVSMVNKALKALTKAMSALTSAGRGLADEPNRGLSHAGDMPSTSAWNKGARGMAFVNPYFSKLYRACRSGCPHSKLPGEY